MILHSYCLVYVALSFFLLWLRTSPSKSYSDFFLLAKMQALSLTIIITLVVTFFPSSSLKIPDTKCGSFFDFFFSLDHCVLSLLFNRD